MNVVFISPNFPPHFYLFCVRLREAGANVLGIGDAPYRDLHPDLRDVLGEYYFTPDLGDYDKMLRAMGYLVHRYGRIDRIDSLNETWLGVEAQLREDFNVPGQRPADLEVNRSKRGMKARFRQAGIPCARGRVVTSAADVRELAQEVDYPLVLKPEIGVGAQATYRVESGDDATRIFADAPGSYLAEEFVTGELVSFDGLCGRSGEIVFCYSTVVSAGVMEIISGQLPMYYYAEREVPPALQAVGEKTVAAFDIRERFFHIEYFRTGDPEVDDIAPGREYVAVEVNVRPPGGFGVHMMNYTSDIDVYDLWARVLLGQVDTARDFTYERGYFVAHVARRWHHQYATSHDELSGALAAISPDLLVAHYRLPRVFAVAMGDEAYFLRHPELAALKQGIALVQR